MLANKFHADKDETRWKSVSVMKALTPETLRPPFARYAHGVEIPAGWRLVQTSGQLGVRVDDSVPEDAYSQAVVCFENIARILRESGMTSHNVAHVSAYVTSRAYMAGYMRARDEFIEEVARAPASTLLIVSGFTRPEFKVEVEALAAAP